MPSHHDSTCPITHRVTKSLGSTFQKWYMLSCIANRLAERASDQRSVCAYVEVIGFVSSLSTGNVKVRNSVRRPLWQFALRLEETALKIRACCLRCIAWSDNNVCWTSKLSGFLWTSSRSQHAGLLEKLGNRTNCWLSCQTALVFEGLVACGLWGCTGSLWS